MQETYDLEGLTEEDFSFNDSSDEYGTWESDPERNKRIGEIFERQRAESEEPRGNALVDRAKVIRGQYLTAKNNRERICLPELRNMARELKALGAHFPKNYRGMSSPRLYKVVEGIVGEILKS
jgi:hypothetical protein